NGLAADGPRAGARDGCEPRRGAQGPRADPFQPERVRLHRLKAIPMAKRDTSPSSCTGQFCGRTRREFLWEMGAGFSGLALSALLDADGFFTRAAHAAPEVLRQGPETPLSPPPQHFPAKAKSCIFLYMYGGPSQMDLFDYKPVLQKLD